ncbi:hypothetical protein [Actinokineospora sp. NBRC 105648]|uniref:hypothetical protein n=1 Tax=Actinokineospora sp. NBRC 105648 TaxID=3032206 RepID=UPI00255573E2|nr:hypothetical protein [Actinokineospora sp. NBRC 105648]
MDDSTYVLFLVLGIALVLVDGQIIYRSGLRYLSDSYGEVESARSMARLVSVLFHFAVLGVVALFSAIDFGGDTVLMAIVRRLGIVLLLLAVAHGLAIKVLTRMRDRLDAENLTKQRAEHRQDHAGPIDEPTPPGGAFDIEAMDRANGTSETRLSRAPGAEPGLDSAPAQPGGAAVPPGEQVPVQGRRVRAQPGGVVEPGPR